MTVADLWAITPLLILAAGAIVVLLCGAVLSGRYAGPVAMTVLAGAALWALRTPPPGATTLGVSLSPFARFFTVLFALTAVAALLLSGDYNARREIRGEEYPATVLFAAFGMAALVAAQNLLVLFLALEALTFAFYILVAMDLGRAASAEAGLKYLLQGAVAAAFIAFGIALIYADSGTLQIAAAMKGAVAGGAANPLHLAGWGFLLVGLAFKVSLVPAHLWTPDVYEGAPTPVVAFLATGSKGAGIAALLLLVAAMAGSSVLRLPLWWLALLSMVVGNLAALLQANVKRLLAYSAIAQMGYVTLALLTFSREGYRGVVFYVVAYTLMNLAAFGAVAVLSKGGVMERVEEYRGAGYARPFPAAVLTLALFALAGVPPTVGFLGKFYVFFAAIRGGEAPLAVLGILTAAVSVYYYLRVVVNLYLRPAEGDLPADRVTWPEGATLAVCAFLILALGVWPAPLLDLIDAIIP
ncbi:MAG TPA: NADH-quinone oxidoreductase subunit N [Geobacteraceae bacterium]